MTGASHLILYDGMCGLCQRMVGFVLRRDAVGVFRFASLQSDLGRSLVERHGRDPGILETFYILSNYQTPSPVLLNRAEAALFYLKQIGGPWRAFGLLSVLPARVLNWGYSLIARNRYRVFGRCDRCFIPDVEYRDRFLDV